MRSKLTIKTPERRQWRRSGVFIVRFEHNYFTPFSNVSIVHFEQATGYLWRKIWFGNEP